MLGQNKTLGFGSTSGKTGGFAQPGTVLIA
jgi:hypothetical protein